MAKEYKCDAVVIYSADFREYDKLLTLYAPTFGKKKVILRGCKKPTAKLRYASTPLFYGEFVIVEGKGYDIVKTVDSKNTFFNIPKDYEKYLDACNILKIVDLNGEYNNSRLLFMLLLTYLSIIDIENSNSDTATAKFMVEILKMQGFELNTATCNTCNKGFEDKVYFDIGLNCFLCETCNRFNCEQIDIDIVKTISTLQNNKFVELARMSFDEKTLKTTKKMLKEIINRQFFLNL